MRDNTYPYSLWMCELNVSISSLMQRLLFCLLQSGHLVVLLPSKCDHKYRLGTFYMLCLHSYKIQPSYVYLIDIIINRAWSSRDVCTSLETQFAKSSVIQKYCSCKSSGHTEGISMTVIRNST